jgi:hypothetical protein
MTDKYISVWYDSTSECAGWIVDICDENENSATIMAFVSDREAGHDGAEAEAREFAARYSHKTGVPIRQEA